MEHTLIHTKRILMALIICITSLSYLKPQKVGIQEEYGPKLEVILEKTGEYCEEVKNLALHYVCKENIIDIHYFYKTQEVIERVPKSSFVTSTIRFELKDSRKKSYVYDYQLIRKSGKMIEKRELLEEDGKKKKEKASGLRYVKYLSKNIVFGPVGFLSRYWQRHFDYKIIGSDIINGKKALIISAYPKQEREENYNVAQIWIDMKEYSILKIQWNPLSIQNYEEEKIRYPTGEYKKTIIWNVDFGVEEKGIRFPSKQIVQEVFISENDKKNVLEEIVFTYTDYKFFTVETEVRYKKNPD